AELSFAEGAQLFVEGDLDVAILLGARLTFEELGDGFEATGLEREAARRAERREVRGHELVGRAEVVRRTLGVPLRGPRLAELVLELGHLRFGPARADERVAAALEATDPRLGIGGESPREELAGEDVSRMERERELEEVDAPRRFPREVGEALRGLHVRLARLDAVDSSRGPSLDEVGRREAIPTCEVVGLEALVGGDVARAFTEPGHELSSRRIHARGLG